MHGAHGQPASARRWRGDAGEAACGKAKRGGASLAQRGLTARSLANWTGDGHGADAALCAAVRSLPVVPARAAADAWAGEAVVGEVVAAKKRGETKTRLDEVLERDMAMMMGDGGGAPVRGAPCTQGREGDAVYKQQRHLERPGVGRRLWVCEAHASSCQVGCPCSALSISSTVLCCTRILASSSSSSS